MNNDTEIQAEITFFKQEIERGRFDDYSLRILESLLVCKDVKSLIEMRLSLTEFLRSKSLSVMHAIREKSVEEKLRILDFFVHSFALLGDIKSCLALKYEALLLRQFKSSSCQALQVSYMEWLDFAGKLLDNGFYPVARHACENALLCLQRDDGAKAKTSEFSAAKRIKRLKEYAVKFSASSSVQAQAAEYLKRKTVENSNKNSSVSKETKCTASILFWNGIKKRNARKLLESQRSQPRICR